MLSLKNFSVHSLGFLLKVVGFVFWVSFLYRIDFSLFTLYTWINLDPIFCVYKICSDLSIKKNISLDSHDMFFFIGHWRNAQPIVHFCVILSDSFRCPLFLR